MKKKTLTDQDIEKIRKNQINQEWSEISYEYKLSESFIREFKDKVEWEYISSSQKLSEPFIKEFKDKVSWYDLFYNPYTLWSVKKKFINIINKELLIYQLSKDI